MPFISIGAFHGFIFATSFATNDDLIPFLFSFPRPQNPIHAGKMPNNDLLFPVGKEFFCWIRERIPQ
jgi:hypothetical protein